MRLPSTRSPVLLHAAVAGVLLAGALSACNRAEQPAVPPAPTDGAEATPPATDTPAAGDAMVTMRYACDGQRIAVFGNDHATVTMDGRDIDLAHVADSSPPRYAGEALELSIAADGAVLAQDEGATWACTAE